MVKSASSSVTNRFNIQVTSKSGGGGGGGFGGVSGIGADIPNFPLIKRNAATTTQAMHVYSASVRQARVAHQGLNASTMVQRRQMNNLGRTLRFVRGQTLGYFFSILFTTMSLERVRQAQRAYDKALKEHGKSSEEAKNADLALKSATNMLYIQFAHIGVQVAMTVVEIYKYLKVRALDIVLTKSAAASKRDEAVALMTLNGMIDVGTKRKIKDAEAKVINTAMTTYMNKATMDSINLATYNIVAGETEINMINKRTLSIWGNVAAKRALLTTSVIGIGLMAAGYVASSMIPKPEGMPSMDDLPSFQTFSGQSKKVPRNMAIFAHAGEVISRPAVSNSTTNSSGGNKITINNKIVMSPNGDSPERAAEKFIKKTVNAFKGTYM